MINIIQIPSVVNHLQSVSDVYKIINNEQIQIHCPFCDDAERKNASNHGHLYIQTEECIFHCFRCEASGTLLKLLISTEFKDYEVIQELSNNIQYSFTKDYYNIKTSNNQIDKLRHTIKQKLLYKSQHQPNVYKQFKNYLFYRLGENINYEDFLISPGNLNNTLSCDFYNVESELILQRSTLFNTNFRFKINKTSSQLYYFQSRDFNKYSRIVLTEGPFDLLNLYLYSHVFKDCIFFSISGKKYTSVIEKLIYQDLFIGNYQINLIFDSDVKNHQSFIYKAKLISEYLNPNIEIKGYVPMFKNTDVGDYPGVIEV